MEEWAHQDSGPGRRGTESPKPEPAFRKRFPESLRFNSSSILRHSRAQSICSSVSSAHIFDTDTTYSASTVASPISTVYEDEVDDFLCPSFTDRPSSRLAERRRQYYASFDSGSTWVGDRDDEDKSNFVKHEVTDTPPVFALSPMQPEEIEGEDEEDLRSPATAQYLSDDEGPLSGISEASFSGRGGTISPRTLMCDTSSIATDEAPGGDADTLLTYTLQLVYGIDVPEQEPQLSALRRMSARYIRELGDAIWQSPRFDGEQPDSQGTSDVSSTSSPTEDGRRGSQSGASQSGGSKRKKGDMPEEEGQGNGQGAGFVPLKKAKPSMREDENLRLNCPFRKRNPHRFNVRDHHSCAMTYFPKFAELRQHIVKQHKRDDPSAFVCDRCNRDFCTRKELREHQRQPKELMCDLADHDPESGIDGPTCNKLLSRKRASGTSSIVQWKEIWNLLFPDDDDHAIRTFKFIPVVEHFELAAQFYASFDQLRASLQDKMSNPATLDTISTKFHQCFAETVEQCLKTAQELPYVNRSNKKGEMSRSAALATRAFKRTSRIQPRPDSAVVMDDGSEESGSVTSSGIRYSEHDAVLGLLNTGTDQPAFTFGDNSSTPAMSLQTPSSAFNPDLLGEPGATLLMADAPGLAPGSQVDFTRLWSDEMMYHMTGAGVIEPDMPQPRSWEDATSYLPFNESSARNIF